MERGMFICINIIVFLYLLVMTTLVAVGKISPLGYVMTIVMTTIFTTAIDFFCLFFSQWKLYDCYGNVAIDLESQFIMLSEEVAYVITRVKEHNTFHNVGAVQQDGDGPEL